MNGIHDMGGMHGMGPVAPEADEPVFHEPWEGRVLALNRATAALGKWNIDTSRHSIERIRPADYLRMSYYEKWLVGLVTRLEESGLVTSAELQSGRPGPGGREGDPAAHRRGGRGGDRRARVVRAACEYATALCGWPAGCARRRSIRPATLVCRATPAAISGSSTASMARMSFPDSNAHFRGENPQHLYSVRFSARELWGEDAAARDAIYIDLWEDYLEPA